MKRDFYKYDEAVQLIGGDEEWLRQAVFRRDTSVYIELEHESATFAVGYKSERHRDYYTTYSRCLLENRDVSSQENVRSYALNGWFLLAPWDAEIAVQRGWLASAPSVRPVGMQEQTAFTPIGGQNWFRLLDKEGKHLESHRVLWLSGVELEAATKKGSDAIGVPGENSHWPWGEHSTELLCHLAAAGRRFWALYDSADHTTAPTNDMVTAWLVERGVALRVAECMAQMLRADGLKRGPRR